MCLSKKGQEKEEQLDQIMLEIMNDQLLLHQLIACYTVANSQWTGDVEGRNQLFLQYFVQTFKRHPRLESRTKTYINHQINPVAILSYLDRDN